MFKSILNRFTPVSNIFIDRYMPKARGEYVKVYLLGLKYCTSGEIGVNSSILSSTLHLLETDVMNAWNYWNDEGVIKITAIDNMGNYNISFLDMSDEQENSSDNVNLLKELSNTSTKDMLQEVEKLIGRPLSSKEMEMYISWQRDFNFSLEIILLVIQYCVSKGKIDSRYIEKVAMAWNDSNIRTVDDAQSYIKKHEDKWTKYKKILNYLGLKDAELMKPQEQMLDKWINIYSFSLEMILRACDICAERLNRPEFKYIDGILTSWHKDGIKTLEELALKDNKRTNNRKPTSSNTGNQKGNFNNYQQRNYDFDDLEKKLLEWESNYD